MADCNELLTAGIERDCDNINAPVGVDKDLILVNYEDFDFAATTDVSNREADDTNGNLNGFTTIFLKTGTIQYTFEGTDYSVVPNVTSEIKEDGDSWYIHNITMTVYSKSAETRKTLEQLGGARVIAIAKDRSTGLYELFGMDQGLKLSAIERAYVGAQNSNFYTVTMASPDIAVIREGNLGELAVSITTQI
jgi:hypothetical protein